MQHLKVSGAVRHIYVIRQLMVNWVHLWGDVSSKAVWLGEWFRTFRRFLLPSYS